jgi:hypothetical protein
LKSMQRYGVNEAPLQDQHTRRQLLRTTAAFNAANMQCVHVRGALQWACAGDRPEMPFLRR